MKPTFQTPELRQRRDSFANFRKAPAPLTDFCFQAGSAGDFYGSPGKGFPSFRGISKDYFRNEARSHFASEAVFFGLIVVTVAVPVIQAIYGLFHLFNGIS